MRISCRFQSAYWHDQPSVCFILSVHALVANIRTVIVGSGVERWRLLHEPRWRAALKLFHFTVRCDMNLFHFEGRNICCPWRSKGRDWMKSKLFLLKTYFYVLQWNLASFISCYCSTLCSSFTPFYVASAATLCLTMETIAMVQYPFGLSVGVIINYTYHWAWIIT